MWKFLDCQNDDKHGDKHGIMGNLPHFTNLKIFHFGSDIPYCAKVSTGQG
jgi:hypothetical protein